jgi:hypothetical protein
VDDGSAPTFHFSRWENGLALYILFIIVLMFVASYFLAHKWDKRNPDYSKPLLESDTTYKYCDSRKVERIVN